MNAPSMTRQHFQFIAEVLKDNQKLGNAEVYWREIVESFASALTMTNAGFKKGRFLQACGYEEK